MSYKPGIKIESYRRDDVITRQELAEYSIVVILLCSAAGALLGVGLLAMGILEALV